MPSNWIIGTAKAKPSDTTRLKDGQPEEITDPLSDSDIVSGNWKEQSVETRTRYTVDKNGIVQIQSFGFRKDLNLKSGKQADLLRLSNHIKDRTNTFLWENKVKNFDQAYSSESGVFADGASIAIKGGITRIISEGVDVTTVLLKTGEIEENVYLSSTKGAAAIHAPGLATGSMEVVAQSVTDLTSLGCLGYDVAVDQDTRKAIYDQFLSIKTQVGEDPKTLIPIFAEVALSVTTGNTAEQWQSTLDKTADSGKRSHLATRGVGNAIVTAMAVTAIVKDLPEMAEKLSERVKAVNKAGGYFNNLKLGKLVGEGGNKNVYEIVGHSDKVIAVLKKGKPISAIEDEIALINTLSENKLPVVDILEKGTFEGQGAIIMRKYSQGSKDIVKRVGNKIEIVGNSTLLNQKSINDLRMIKNTLVNQQIKIDDLQFLISNDGSIVISDPLDIYIRQSPSKWNTQMIDKLIEVASKNIK